MYKLSTNQQASSVNIWTSDISTARDPRGQTNRTLNTDACLRKAGIKVTKPTTNQSNSPTLLLVRRKTEQLNYKTDWPGMLQPSAMKKMVKKYEERARTANKLKSVGTKNDLSIEEVQKQNNGIVEQHCKTRKIGKVNNESQLQVIDEKRTMTAHSQTHGVQSRLPTKFSDRSRQNSVEGIIKAEQSVVGGTTSIPNRLHLTTDSSPSSGELSGNNQIKSLSASQGAASRTRWQTMYRRYYQESTVSTVENMTSREEAIENDKSQERLRGQNSSSQRNNHIQPINDVTRSKLTMRSPKYRIQGKEQSSKVNDKYSDIKPESRPLTANPLMKKHCRGMEMTNQAFYQSDSFYNKINSSSRQADTGSRPNHSSRVASTFKGIKRAQSANIKNGSRNIKATNGLLSSPKNVILSTKGPLGINQQNTPFQVTLPTRLKDFETDRFVTFYLVSKMLQKKTCRGKYLR